MSDRRRITIDTADGEPVTAYFREAQAARAFVIIAGATGVKQQFYWNFSDWLVEHGFSVLTFDFRGVGESLSGDLKNCRARLQDWGALDMTAVVAWATTHIQAATHSQANGLPLPLHLIGHSVGGQLVGLMPNHGLLTSVIQVASSSGYFKGMPLDFRIKTLLLLRSLPLLTKIRGFTPTKIVRYGENLPAGVGLQWADWCLHPGYVENAFGKTIKEHFYDQFKAPILSISSTDDPIATTKNVDDLLRLFTVCSIKRLRLQPSDFGMRTIGHIDFFRKRCSNLWSLTTDWLDGTV